MKSKSTTILLTFLLGGLGVHRFYLGQTGKGILYLLFFSTFIPLLISIIDGIMFLTMDDNKFNTLYNPQILLQQLEEKRLNDLAVLAEEKRLADEKLAEEKRLADEKLAEEKRLADEKLAEERLAERQAMEKRITEMYGEEIANKIFNREIWLDMKSEHLLLIKGNPTNIEKSITKKKNKVVYVYGNKNSGDVFTFIDDMLTEYKDR